MKIHMVRLRVAPAGVREVSTSMVVRTWRVFFVLRRFVGDIFVQKISKKTEGCIPHQERLFGSYLCLYQADKAGEMIPSSIC